MSKSIYVCSRLEQPISVKYRLEEICSRLAADNIKSHAPKIEVNGDIAFGIVNPAKKIIVKGKSLLAGCLYDRSELWDLTGSEFPDGTFAIFREGGGYVEIVTDPAGSRTIWYYMDDSQFIASTSQRAIIMYIKSFNFDEKVIPWMLSTGTLGPFSWDKRIKRVPADSSVVLDKKKWEIKLKSNPIEFRPVKRTDAEHEELIKESLRTTIRSLQPDYSRWVVPLSGGYDSRAIICLLLESCSEIKRPKTITWGTKEASSINGNDARVASELARILNLRHRYYTYKNSEESLDDVINRFINNGEGRIDDLSDYMDGFAVWKSIYEEGIEGIIRGDESFGWNPVSSAQAVRINVECGLCTDFANLKDYLKFGLPFQEVPSSLMQKQNETYSQWRDRLFLEYMQPVVQAALTDLKLAYVEQINPLLAGNILKLVRQLPDHLRDGRAIFKRIVKSISPVFEFATSPSSYARNEILKQANIVSFIRSELTTDGVKALFSEEFLSHVLGGIKYAIDAEHAKSPSPSLSSVVRKLVPSYLKQTVRDKFLMLHLDDNLLAFRILMINRMNILLNRDCRHSDYNLIKQVS